MFLTSAGLQHSCIRAVEGMRLDHVLRSVCYLRPVPWLARQLLGGLALRIDCNVSDAGFLSTADPLVFTGGTHHKRQRACRRVRQVLMDLPVSLSRNAYRTTKLLRSANAAVGFHKSWVDGAYMRRYLIASRYNLAGSSSLGITVDKSNHWLVGCLYSHDRQCIGWMPPQATILGSGQEQTIGANKSSS